MTTTFIRRFWNWLKAILAKIFQRRKNVEIPRPEPKVERYINTPNMPKRQPCPLCKAWVKRIRKTFGGAHYYCRACKGGVFVRAK